MSKIINEINTIETIHDHYYDIEDVEVEFFDYFECMIFNYEMYKSLINLSFGNTWEKYNIPPGIIDLP